MQLQVYLNSFFCFVASSNFRQISIFHKLCGKRKSLSNITGGRDGMWCHFCRQIGTQPYYTVTKLSAGTLYFMRLAIWADARATVLGNLSEAYWVMTLCE